MNFPFTSTNTRVPRISREQARRFPCPKCGAPAGQLCKKEGGGFRGTNHAERAQAIRQAHLSKAKAAVDTIPDEAWNFAKAYLENLGRSSVVTGLTPSEEEIGYHAFSSMNSNTNLLVTHHAERKSFSDIAAGWGRSQDTVVRLYEEAFTQFAIRLTPMVSKSCAVCREQMLEVVTNQCLRCPDCRIKLEDIWRQRAPVTGIRSRSATLELSDASAVLQIQPGDSLETIRRARDTQLGLLAWAFSDDAPAHIQSVATMAGPRSTMLGTFSNTTNPIENFQPHCQSMQLSTPQIL